MPTRNTSILKQIVTALGDLVEADAALARLEQVYEDRLLIVAGDADMVEKHAEELRLLITQPEHAQVLDYIERHKLARMTLDHVEEAINALFPDRFIEP